MCIRDRGPGPSGIAYLASPLLIDTLSPLDTLIHADNQAIVSNSESGLQTACTHGVESARPRRWLLMELIPCEQKLFYIVLFWSKSVILNI